MKKKKDVEVAICELDERVTDWDEQYTFRQRIALRLTTSTILDLCP